MRRAWAQFAAILVVVVGLGSGGRFCLAATPTLICASVGLAGVPAGGAAEGFRPDLSSDGRYVTFASAAAEMTGWSGGVYQVYRYDQTTGQVLPISQSEAGEEANAPALRSHVSSTGRYVAFDSAATNLVTPTLSTTCSMIYLADVDQGTVELVNLANDGQILQDPAGRALDCALIGLSEDGQRILFYASNWETWDDATRVNAIFERDRLAGTTTVVLDAKQELADASLDVHQIDLSSDERWLVYSWQDQVYAYDRDPDHNGVRDEPMPFSSTLVSINENGDPASQPAGFPAVSGDGRFVAYESWATNLDTGDTNNSLDVFVIDRDANQNGVLGEPLDVSVTRVSLASTGQEGNGHSYRAGISDDGQSVVFVSDATNMVPGGSTGLGGVFLVSLSDQTVRCASISNVGLQANGFCSYPVLSANGRYVAFPSNAANLIDGDTNRSHDVFVFDRHGDLAGATPGSWGVVSRVSVSTAGEQADGNSMEGSVSATGRFVAFASMASNLTTDGIHGPMDIYVRDRDADQDGVYDERESGGCVVYRESGSYDGSPLDGVSYTPFLSADGSQLAFTSTASNLTPGDTNVQSDVFVVDRPTGVTRRVSVSSVGEQANAGSFGTGLSADGRFVVFNSDASNLVPQDTNGSTDVFLYDRDADENGTLDEVGAGTWSVRCVSRNAAGDAASGTSSGGAISADGRYIAFVSNADDLTVEATYGVPQVYLYDRQLGTIRLASSTALGVPADGDCTVAAVSSGEPVVAFGSWASNLISGTPPGQIFLKDMASGATSLVSTSTQGVASTGSFPASVDISADGRYVAFVSSADNIVDDDFNSSDDAFVWDRQTRKSTRVTVASSEIQANGSSHGVSLNDDGRSAVFFSWATNLTPDDTNASMDVFVYDRELIYTPVAEDVVLSLPDAGQVLLRLVSEAGATSVITQTTNPGDDLGGDQATGDFQDIATTAGFDASEGITVTLPYDDTGMTPQEEASVRLMHYRDGALWEDCTISVDTVANTVTGVIYSLSWFVPSLRSEGPSEPLDVAFAANPEHFCPSYTLYYGLVMTNTQETALHNVLISNTLPANTCCPADGIGSMALAQYDPTLNALQWDIGTLEANEVVNLEWTLHSFSSIADGVRLTNTLSYSAEELDEPRQAEASIVADSSLCAQAAPTLRPTATPSAVYPLMLPLIVR